MIDIQTGSFSIYKGEHGVSVARGTPRWFKGEQIIELCPSWGLIRDVQKKKITEEEYTVIYYRDYLCGLDAQKYIERLNGKILLCWEKPGDFCHRRIIAEWIERETGIVVPEYVSKKPSKKNEEQLFLL